MFPSLVIFLFQLPELRAQHDVAIMAAYASKDLEIEELKTEAQRQWEERDMKASPDLGLMTKADIHGSKTEQGLGRETLVDTQASLLEATGASTLTDESRQYLLLSVSVGNVLEYAFFSHL